MKRTELRRKKPWRPKPKLRESRLEFHGIAIVEDANIPKGRMLVVKPRTPLKPSRPKSTPARAAAKGQPCLIRLPGCAPGAENETVVLCHYRLTGACGIGLKPDDALAALGCHHCHAVVDGRQPPPPGYTHEDVRLAFAEGVMRTILYMKALQSGK